MVLKCDTSQKKEMCGVLTAHSKKTRVEPVSFEIECARGFVVEDSIITVCDV